MKKPRIVHNSKPARYDRAISIDGKAYTRCASIQAAINKSLDVDGIRPCDGYLVEENGDVIPTYGYEPQHQLAFTNCFEHDETEDEKAARSAALKSWAIPA